MLFKVPLCLLNVLVIICINHTMYICVLSLLTNLSVIVSCNSILNSFV